MSPRNCACRSNDKRWLFMCDEHKAEETRLHAQAAADHIARCPGKHTDSYIALARSATEAGYEPILAA